MTKLTVLRHAVDVNHERHSKETNSAAEEQTSRLTKEQHALLLRMYSSPVRAAIVRLIGYDSWDYLDARDQLVRLMKRFGVTQVTNASGELVVRRDRGQQDVVMLNDDARQLAVWMLGRPKADGNGAKTSLGDHETEIDDEDNSSPLPLRRSPREPIPDVAENEVATDYVRVEETRKKVIERCQRMFEVHGQSCERASKATIPTRPEKTPVAFDLVVKRDDERHLITVRRELTKPQPNQLKRWLDALGPDWRAARMWPIRLPEGTNDWLWECDWIGVPRPPFSRPL